MPFESDFGNGLVVSNQALNHVAVHVSEKKVISNSTLDKRIRNVANSTVPHCFVVLGGSVRQLLP